MCGVLILVCVTMFKPRQPRFGELNGQKQSRLVYVGRKWSKTEMIVFFYHKCRVISVSPLVQHSYSIGVNTSLLSIDQSESSKTRKRMQYELY